jgi:hypothetical protein
VYLSVIQKEIIIDEEQNIQTHPLDFFYYKTPGSGDDK